MRVRASHAKTRDSTWWDVGWHSWGRRKVVHHKKCTSRKKSVWPTVTESTCKIIRLKHTSWVSACSFQSPLWKFRLVLHPHCSVGSAKASLCCTYIATKRTSSLWKHALSNEITHVTRLQEFGKSYTFAPHEEWLGRYIYLSRCVVYGMRVSIL